MTIDFVDLELKATPHQYLVCPDGMAPKCSRNDESPVYDVPVDKLRRIWRDVALSQPRVAMVRDDPNNYQCEFIQRSFLFRFPDTITVQFVPIDDEHSTCAIFSRSRYGYRDMGVNRRRVQRWMGAVSKRVAQENQN